MDCENQRPEKGVERRNDQRAAFYVTWGRVAAAIKRSRFEVERSIRSKRKQQETQTTSVNCKS